MSTDNGSTASDRLDGVSIRVNGVTHGAQAHYDNAYHIAGKAEPTVRVGSGPNQANTFVAFDEQHIGDLSAVQPFRDTYEVQAAMRDPRYQRSGAYRNEVMRRMAAMQQG